MNNQPNPLDVMSALLAQDATARKNRGWFGRFVDDAPGAVQTLGLMASDQIYPGTHRPGGFSNHGPMAYSTLFIFLFICVLVTITVVSCFFAR